jgi:selenocysteine lyase/cysteine desulfurase
VIELDALRRTPNALAAHYGRARVSERLLLTGHSHQAWPDVALQGQIEAFEDAARALDEKWELAFAKADEVRAGFARWLGEDRGAVAIALGASTHELIIRFLSALDLRRRPRLVTTDGEFHTLRRQTRRLREEGVDVVTVSSEPAETLAERLADGTADPRTSAVLVSSVLFETARVVPGLELLAAVCEARGVELLVDVYHALGPVPTSVSEQRLEAAWIVGGGYKYLQLGEGNCFLRLPPHAAQLRPAITGWYAEFDTLTAARDEGPVAYGPGPARFAGSTYDPTSHYRAARVIAFFAEHGLTRELLAASYRHQMELLAGAFDALGAPERLIARDRSAPLSSFGGFLALRTPHAAALQRALFDRGVHTDSRRNHLRLGPAPYMSDAQLEAAIDHLGHALTAV